MARRVTAVSLACLLAAGFTPPLRPGAAVAAGCARNATVTPRAPRVLEAAGRPGTPGPPGPRSPKPEDVAKVMAELERRLAGAAPPAQITVPTRVHVIARGQRQVSDEAIRTQIDTLNAAYGGRYGGVDTGVRFRLDGISVKENGAWFADPVGSEKAMKQALHQGGANTLNLYIAQLSELMLGFAGYPYWYADAPALDGVVIDWRSLPGGAMTNYNRGFTGVHEIGHWLGLFHTFENGCAEPGDGIGDTPAEAKPTEECPEGKDTCTAHEGQDPMHNFMDYAHDRCMSEFTAGQAERMRGMWVAYRDATVT
ncbi:Pregnancy-associated plasma protein-A [Nonomuraea solani]|uniref:Pregnancy-associated plasma protein-A n=1 Tax=Nonomuraea solani TaxID=1144553 RepID=A0A1H6B9Y9_9ACTN|nr:zinc metalloprotease [Nonomuraea solani]SEG57215.1 Pregnancy-associated plasma protein-A [Nonomuraea solani]